MANAPKFYLFGVVINAPQESPQTLDDLRAYEQRLQECKGFYFVATIIHDKDTLDNGEPKRPHLHAFVDFGKGNDKTIRQALELLASETNTKTEQISIEGTDSNVLLVQYQTHQNHPAKAQYDRSLIKTNNRERLDQILDTKYQAPKDDEDYLQQAIFESSTLADLIGKIGLKEANKYRLTFNQIKDDQKKNLEGLAKELDNARNDANALYLMLLKIVRLYEHKALTDEDLKEANDLIALMDLYRVLQ